MKKKIMATAVALMLGFSALAVGCSDDIQSNAVLLEEGKYFYTEKQTPQTVNKLAFDFLGGDDVMPIGGFYGPYASGGSTNGFQFPDFVQEKYYKLLSDAGVNMVVYSRDNDSANKASILESLELGEEYGIGYFVSSSELDTLAGRSTTYQTGDELPFDLDTLADKMQEFSQYDSFLGMHVVDEPFWQQMDGLTKAYMLMDEIGYSSYPLFSNALGYSVTDFVRGGYQTNITADQYYDELFNRVGFNFLSATGYYYTEKDTADDDLSKMFSDLSALWQLSKEYNVPLWRMLQAGGQWNDAAVEIESVDPYPNEAEVLFDVNIALAYGCKAIQYFPLIQPLHFAYAPNGTYDFDRCGLLSAAGGVTQWYYYAQKANKQVKAVDHVLMNAESMGLIVHGSKAKELALVGSTSNRADIISSGTFRQLQRVSGDDCFIGCFDYLGGTALYVVNYSRTEKANVALEFDNYYGYDIIQRAQTASVMGNAFDLVLQAGEGALITLR